MNTHFMLDRTAGHAIARAQGSVRIDIQLRHHKQRQSLGALRCALTPRQHQMNDVFGQIMLACGDEYFLPCQRIRTIGLRHGFGFDQAQIGAALRLGEVHGAQPVASGHFRHIKRLLCRRAMLDQRRHSPLCQAGIHGEGHVGGGAEFIDQRPKHIGQALPAKFHRCRQPHPAALGIDRIGIPEAARGCDCAI